MGNETQAAIVAVIVLVVGFAVAGLSFTFIQALGGQTYEIVEDNLDSINSYTDVNHTFVADNTTWVSLGNVSLRNAVMYNSTAWTVNTSNFDINLTTGYLILISDNASLNGTTMYAVYQYDDGIIRNAVKGGILSSFEAQEHIGNYMPIMALAIIITIIIGLIIGGIASKFVVPVNKSQGNYDGFV